MKTLKAQKALQKILFYAGNTIIGIIFVSPLIWMISASLKPEAKIFANMNSIQTFVPEDASFDNFIELFRRVDLMNVFENTITYILLIAIYLFI